MTDRPKSDVGAGERDAIAQLLRAAGRRTDPPAAAYERVLDVATDAWQAKIRRRRRTGFALGLAAFLIVSGSAIFVYTRPPPPASVVARTDRVVGTVEVRATADDAWMTLGDEPRALTVGSEVRTRVGSRAGLVLDDGASLRVADATDVVLGSTSRLQVLSGCIYVDTGSAEALSRARPIEVVTARGVARDIGTQFEVLYRNEVYRLRVREGRVLLSRREPGLRSKVIDGSAGEQLRIDANGALERTAFGAQDSQWQWVESVAPVPDIDAQPLMMLLTWVGRETGKAIRFASPDVERRASRTILHGSIRYLAPLEALQVMLATTDFEPAVSDDAILVRLKGR